MGVLTSGWGLAWYWIGLDPSHPPPTHTLSHSLTSGHLIDPSAAAAIRRAEFLGMRRAAAEFFYGSAESQPNFSNVPASRLFFGANSARTYTVV